MSSYPTSLSYLIDTFHISGRELSDYLGVDHSMISKWKNNHRPLTLQSSYIDPLTTFFLETQNGLFVPRIQEILSHYYPNDPLDNKEQLFNNLKLWLCEEYENINTIHSIKNNNRLSADQKICSIRSGNAGRQTAVLEFLDAAIGLSEPARLFLVSQENMSWITENPDFLSAWRQKILEVLQKGHQIQVIHWVSRSNESLGGIIAQWMPLYLSGKVRSWYLPVYTQPEIPATLFIIKDYQLILGMEGASDRERYTAVFTDAISLHHYQTLFNRLLSQCRPLVSIYKVPEDTINLESVFTGIPQSTNSISIAAMPGFHTLPESLFNTILQEQHLSKKTIKLCFDYYHWLNKINGGKAAKEIYSKVHLQEALQQETYIYHDLSLLAQKKITVKRSTLIQHMRSFLEQIQNDPSTQIGLLNAPVTANTYIRQETGVLSWNPALSPYLVMASEPNIVEAFYQQHQSIWNSIPDVDKDKNLLLQKLYATFNQE